MNRLNVLSPFQWFGAVPTEWQDWLQYTVSVDIAFLSQRKSI